MHIDPLYKIHKINFYCDIIFFIYKFRKLYFFWSNSKKQFLQLFVSNFSEVQQSAYETLQGQNNASSYYSELRPEIIGNILKLLSLNT